jgi:hypothetical protein
MQYASESYLGFQLKNMPYEKLSENDFADTVASALFWSMAS